MPFQSQHSPPQTKQNNITDHQQQQQTLLQTILRKYNLQSIQQLSQILFDPQLSQLFKQRYPQLSANNNISNNNNNNQQQQQQQISSRLQKMALQHSYNQMYIYYQQFPHLLKQCKNVLKFKYHFDDILRTHNNRKSIWLLCSGALRRIKQNPHYYQEINALKQQSYPEYFNHTIEKDVVRTISEQQLQQRQSLSRILRNFAIRNPYIGYCQGMNFIVNFLLQMQFTEQQIFWLIVQMFQNHLPKSYYTNMLGVGVDICIMEQYIKVYYPSLSEKLIEMGLSLSLFTLQWLVCLFTSTLPFYVHICFYCYLDVSYSMGHVIDLWSVNINKSMSDNFRLALINNFTYDRFMYFYLLCRSAQLLIKIQQKKKGIFIDQNKFIARIMTIYIDQDLLTFCRQLLQIKLNQDKVDGGQNINKNKQNKKNLQVNCNIEWPICHKTLKSYKTDLGQIQIWTFKQENPPKIIKDYLQLKNKQSYKPIEDNRSKQKKLLIGRIPHTCDITKYNRKQSIGKQSIELEQFNKSQSQRKIIYDKLQTMTEKLGIQNQHVKFFRRAAQQKLDLLQFSILNKNNSIRSSFSNHRTQQTNIKTHSITYSQKQIETASTQNTNNNQEDLKMQTKNQTQTINDDLTNKKTRNPFKKLKFKWNQRKNKQKTQQQS